MTTEESWLDKAAREYAHSWSYSIRPTMRDRMFGDFQAGARALAEELRKREFAPEAAGDDCGGVVEIDVLDYLVGKP